MLRHRVRPDVDTHYTKYSDKAPINWHVKNLFLGSLNSLLLVKQVVYAFQLGYVSLISKDPSFLQIIADWTEKCHNNTHLQFTMSKLWRPVNTATRVHLVT